MRTYEQRYERLADKVTDIGSEKGLAAYWDLLHFHADTQDGVLNLVEAVRALAAARKANPYLVRLGAEEEAVLRRLKELDNLGK